MSYDPMEFSEKLLKGRIAETIFEQMFRDAGRFTILSFGYESVLPELAHRQDEMQAEETMEIIRRAPDFAVIHNDTHDVHLIEVKYMMHPFPERIFKAAQLMFESWKPSYLFIATPQRFYFGKVSEIVQQNGYISPLDDAFISNILQERYSKLLNSYIVPR